MARPSRTAISMDDPTYLWKLILRILSILFGLTAIGLMAWALTHDINTFNYYAYDYSSNRYWLPWILLPLGPSVVWNTANVATLLLKNRPLHPGANVALDLILWLAFLVTTTFATIGGALYVDSLYYVNVYTCDRSPLNVNCNSPPDLQKTGVIIEVGASLAFLIMLFHFALFISACRYTHQRNHPMRSVPAAHAVTQEATEIARKMIADMTGPNGQFVPIDKQHQYKQQQLHFYNQTRDLEMQQQQQQNTSRDPRSQPLVTSSGNSDANIPIAPPPEIMVRSPSANEKETHPAFRAR
ncbi:hypothetical protein N7G274_009184 [Stereocaulon virgatum]|uniref:MARVEL domain-containing protein n=1 Tax=Stereocaulon virgatum TaxID=373712 RepID=A0ABR3ZYU3_9LECA